MPRATGGPTQREVDMILARSSIHATLALAAVLIGGGCSKDKDPVAALADYESRTQQIVCQLALECCTDDEIPQWTTMPMEMLTTCAEVPQDVSEAVERLYGPALDAGHVRFDQGRADACIDAWESLTCAGYAAAGGVGDNICDDPHVPLQGPGDPCNQGWECTTGFCEGGSMMTEGTCGTPPGAGEECSITCAEGYYCSIFDTCEPLVSDGEPCGFHRDCESGFCFTPESGTEDVCGVMCDGR
jgi:hypothetical protein